MIHRFSFPTTIHFGPGARHLVAEHLKAQSVRRPLVVTDRGIAPLPLLADFVADLPGLMAQLHRRGLKGYVTLNTLVFTNELPAVEELVQKVAAAGVDAVLVQDLGLVRLIRSLLVIGRDCSGLAARPSFRTTRPM